MYRMRKPYQNFKPASILQEKLLSRYQQQLFMQQQLLLAIRAALPENLGKHVDYAVWNQNKAVLFTQSSVFATQLRFYAAAVQTHLSGLKNFSQIEHVQVRLIVPTGNAALPPRQAHIPSGETIHFLSNSITSGNKSDPLLQALQNLGKTLEKRAQQKDSGE